MGRVIIPSEEELYVLLDVKTTLLGDDIEARNMPTDKTIIYSTCVWISWVFF